MRIARTLRVIGYVLFVVAGLPLALDPHMRIDRHLAPWLCAYFALGVAFHVGASAPETDRRRRLLALGAMVPAMLAMAALQPCHFGSLTLVIVASQAALVLAPPQLAALIAGQTLALGYFLVCSEAFQEGIGTMLVLLAGQTFAAVAVHAARREAEAKNDLERTNAELRATRSLLEETSRVNERTRIARELHDVLGHDLTALGLQLEVATHVPPERAGGHVAKAQEVSARLLHNVRDVVTAMRDAPPPDLTSALRTLVQGVPGLEVHLAMPDVLRVDDGARGHCILRCVQEIVTNAMRHAQAKNLWITIAQTDDAITVDAKDDGRGAEEVRAGHGLSGMRARLEELGGWLRVATEPSREFAVSAWLPAKGTAP
jgi:signal transduction histidine kinase